MALEKFYQDKINNFPYKNIAVFGMGKSGISTLRLLDFLKVDHIAINQGEIESWSKPILESLPNLSTKFISQESLELELELSNCDLIILSPGIARELHCFDNIKCPIWCEIELAYYFCENSSKIVSVTGTNGKTTTVSLLEECLKNSGISYFVGGNIGTPFCDYIFELLSAKIAPAEIIALELSSFQLESLFNFKSHIACILNITFSHGERYEDITPYAHAKLRILNNQNSSDFAFIDSEVVNEYKLTHTESIDLDNIENLKNILTQVLDLNAVKIVGTHNIKNIFFVYKIWMALGLDLTFFKNACYSFGGVHYRLERLGEFYCFEVFNDSKSTNWEATETAIKGVFDRGEITLILGGQKRGQGDKRIDVIRPFFKYIKHIYLIGESGEDLFELVKSEISSSYVGNFSALKKEIIKNRRKGVLLFSPAFPSFDQFKSYVDRGQKFLELFN